VVIIREKGRQEAQSCGVLDMVRGCDNSFWDSVPIGFIATKGTTARNKGHPTDSFPCT